MPHAHDGARRRSVATARAGDGSFLVLSRVSTDLVNTGGIVGYETLHTPADLHRWCSALLGVHPTPDATDLAAAHALRGAIRALIDDPSDLAARMTLNGCAAGQDVAPRLTATGDVERVAGSASAVLTTVARDAVEVLARLRDRIRTCAEPTCALVFVDESRTGCRVWCAPQRCGDRARARAHRARTSTGTAPTDQEEP